MKNLQKKVMFHMCQSSSPSRLKDLYCTMLSEVTRYTGSESSLTSNCHIQES